MLIVVLSVTLSLYCPVEGETEAVLVTCAFPTVWLIELPLAR